MKEGAIVRNLDDKGRLTLPRDLLNNLRINPNDELEFLVDGNKIILKRKKFYIKGGKDR